MVRHAPHDVAARVVTHLSVDTHAIDILLLRGSLGWLIRGVSTFRSRQLTRVAAVLVGIGGFSSTFTSGGPIRVLVVGTAVLLLVGTGLAAAYLTKGARSQEIVTAGAQS
jgi:asparagine N-glycosylation enzyme membrane subunit Stt3